MPILELCSFPLVSTPQEDTIGFPIGFSFRAVLLFSPTGEFLFNDLAKLATWHRQSRVQLPDHLLCIVRKGFEVFTSDPNKGIDVVVWICELRIVCVYPQVGTQTICESMIQLCFSGWDLNTSFCFIIKSMDEF